MDKKFKKKRSKSLKNVREMEMQDSSSDQSEAEGSRARKDRKEKKEEKKKKGGSRIGRMFGGGGKSTNTIERGGKKDASSGLEEEGDEKKKGSKSRIQIKIGETSNGEKSVNVGEGGDVEKSNGEDGGTSGSTTNGLSMSSTSKLRTRKKKDKMEKKDRKKKEKKDKREKKDKDKKDRKAEKAKEDEEKRKKKEEDEQQRKAEKEKAKAESADKDLQQQEEKKKVKGSRLSLRRDKNRTVKSDKDGGSESETGTGTEDEGGGSRMRRRRKNSGKDDTKRGRSDSGSKMILEGSSSPSRVGSKMGGGSAESLGSSPSGSPALGKPAKTAGLKLVLDEIIANQVRANAAVVGAAGSGAGDSGDKKQPLTDRPSKRSGEELPPSPTDESDKTSSEGRKILSFDTIGGMSAKNASTEDSDRSEDASPKKGSKMKFRQGRKTKSMMLTNGLKKGGGADSPNSIGSFVTPMSPKRTRDVNANVKILLAGATAGKSCLLARFANGEFLDDYDPTIEDSGKHKLVVDDVEYVLQTLDMSGDASYSHFYQKWFAWPAGVMFIYNVTEVETFHQMKEMRKQILRVRQAKNVPGVLIGTHCDLKMDRQVLSTEGRSLAYEWNCTFLETSARTGKNVLEAFESIVREIRDFGKERVVSPGLSRLEREQLWQEKQKEEQQKGASTGSQLRESTIPASPRHKPRSRSTTGGSNVSSTEVDTVVMNESGNDSASSSTTSSPRHSHSGRSSDGMSSLSPLLSNSTMRSPPAASSFGTRSVSAVKKLGTIGEEDEEDLDDDEEYEVQDMVARIAGYELEASQVRVMNHVYRERDTGGVEYAEHNLRWYRDYFLANDHKNFIGQTDEHGPVAVSILKEKIGPKKAQWRVIVRSKQAVAYKQFLKKDFEGSKVTTERIMAKSEVPMPFEHMRQITDPKLKEELLIFEDGCRVTRYKFGVLLQRAGQTKEEEMFGNEHAPPAFEKFLHFLGDRVALQGWTRYNGGLDTEGREGEFAVYATFLNFEIMFHVSTLLPYSRTNPQQLERKRHIGNDVCVLVFQDDDTCTFSPDCISSDFNHVFLVVREELDERRKRIRAQRRQLIEAKKLLATKLGGSQGGGSQGDNVNFDLDLGLEDSGEISRGGSSSFSLLIPPGSPSLTSSSSKSSPMGGGSPEVGHMQRSLSNSMTDASRFAAVKSSHGSSSPTSLIHGGGNGGSLCSSMSAQDKVRYRLVVTQKDGVPPFGPALPFPPVFEAKLPQFRDLILRKLINGENASGRAAVFLNRKAKIREAALRNVIRPYLK